MSQPVDLQFPIGPYEPPATISAEQVGRWIDQIERLPADLRRVVEPLTEAQLDTPYRPGGWTARQVIHHIPDSHLNGYIRCKWALTEERPAIKAYDQDGWAQLVDSRAPVGLSLDLLSALAGRWVVLLRALGEEDLARSFLHPEAGELRLDTCIGLYAWHGRHHLAHVEIVAGERAI